MNAARRRQAAVALGAAGLALVGYAGTAAARSALAEDRARAEWEATLARHAIERTRIMMDATPLARPAEGAPIARLVIPTARIDHIVVEGVEERSLMAGPGHVPESVMPGQPGNAVIAAHRDRHFRRLGNVSPGDTVVTETLQGPVKWVVTERRILAGGTVVALEGDEPLLTLSTCWPIMALGPAPDRLVLTARPIG